MPSHFPGKLLTNGSVGRLDYDQLRHIEATYAYARWKVELGDLKSQQFLPLLGYIKQLILDCRTLAMLLTGMPNESWAAADNPEFRRRPPSRDANAPPRFLGMLLGNHSDAHLDTEQIRHVNEVYEELIQLKTEVHRFEDLPYDYLLGCMEQLIHHCRSIRGTHFMNKRINRS